MKSRYTIQLDAVINELVMLQQITWEQACLINALRIKEREYGPYMN